MPQGFELRDKVLDILYNTARLAAPDAINERQLADIRSSDRKLEFVLGRLWGTIGDDALRCLLALRLEVPNRAHMAAAHHLLRGGTHVTVNFDVGIEIAYDLLRGACELPTSAPADFDSALQKWRALVPPDPSPLRVVVTRHQFLRWSHDPRPALLKIHGSLTRNQDDLADVVVVDNEELNALSEGRLAAVQFLAECDELVVTGYSGADPDVYGPLLKAAPQRTRWCCPQLNPRSQVPADLAAGGLELHLGIPDGLAHTAIGGLLDDHLPAWPEIPVAGQHFDERFLTWSRWCTQRHDSSLFGAAWGWMLADLGDFNAAALVFEDLRREEPVDPFILVRHAEVLYTRAGPSDRDRAAQLYRRISRVPHSARSLRLHSRLRSADIARGKATRSPTRHLTLLAALIKSTVAAVWVIVATCNGRREPEVTADAYRLIQQTLMRGIERVATTVPERSWPALTAACHLAQVSGRRAHDLSENGNRRIMLRSRSCHLHVLAALLRRREPDVTVMRDLETLHDTYWNADDRNGAANCTVSLALGTAVGDPRGARILLNNAEDEYRQATATGKSIPSGQAFLNVATTLIARIA